MRIAHVALWCADLDRVGAFWSSFFAARVGAPYESARRPGFRSRFVTFGDGGTTLELMTLPGLPLGRPDEHVGWAHVAVSVGSEEAVDALAERARREGCLEAPPRRTGDGFYEAVLRDPEGNRVEITA